MATVTLKGIELTELQRDIYNATKLDSKYQYIVVSTGRQVGKTTLAIQVALNWCINNKGFKLGFFMPVFKQCKKVFSSFEKGLKKSEIAEFNKTDLTITFKHNDSTIQFFTSENDNCRGFTFDSIICDESCFIKDDIFTAAILPTVAVALSKGTGKVLLTSTPKSKNWFFTYFSGDMENKIAIKATSEQGGLISKDVLASIKKSTPDWIYRNEYLAEFLDAGEGVFAYVDCLMNEKPTNTQGCVAGLDFGMENDYTALAIMNNSGELVHLQRWRGVDWMDLLDTIAAKLKEFKVNRVYAEINGIGNMPAKMLQKKFSATAYWTTTNKSKVDIINKLSADFKQNLIKIPKIDYLMDELDAYTLDYTPATGKVTYGARSGFNDDCVMALAIANWNRITSGKRMISSR
jgi:hypothetical protein